MTPAAYVEELRVERARQLLEESADPVELVSARCGFGTPGDDAPRLLAPGRRRPGRVPRQVPANFRVTPRQPTERRSDASRLPALRPLHRPRHHRAARRPQLGARQRVDLRRRAGRGRSGTSPTRSPWSPTPRWRRCRAPTSSSSPAASATGCCSSTSRCTSGSAACTRPAPGPPRSAPARCCSPPRGSSTAPPRPPTGWPATCSPSSVRSPSPTASSSTARSSPPPGSRRESTWPSTWSRRSTGREVAQAVQLGIEYDPQPPHDAGSPEKAPPEIVELVTAAFEAREAARRRVALRQAAAPTVPAGRCIYDSAVNPPATTALIMAAGQGTRMRSAVPKVLHEVCGRPMIAWPILAAREAGAGRVCVIVSPDHDLSSVLPEGTETIVQPVADGTGGALRAAARRRSRLGHGPGPLRRHPAAQRRGDRRPARRPRRGRRGRDDDDHRARRPGHLRPRDPHGGRRRPEDRRGEEARRCLSGGARGQGGERRAPTPSQGRPSPTPSTA